MLCGACQPLACVQDITSLNLNTIYGLKLHPAACWVWAVLSPRPQFVVYEQFFEHMPGSPGRGSKGGSTSVNSSASWGPGALSSLGHGRQTLHIIGSRAAVAAGVDPCVSDQWVSHNSLQRG